jgi:type I restriction-modification system DNA methylase subunit
MKYTTINIQGNLISEEILQKIDQAEAPGQTAAHFGLEQGANLRSEIEYAWSRIKLDWNYFADKSQNLPANDPYGTTLTRRWMEQFLSSIGFNLARQRSHLAGDNGQTYQISHTDENMDSFPVHIVNFLEPSHPDKNTLDIRTSGGTTRFSPHATMQEYLNVTEHVYGLVTNGLSLRLIRDSGRLIKLTYLEFDLKRMLDEDKYSEFTVLYRLLHATRFPRRKQEAADSFIDKYYQDSIETGNRIRNGLSQAVKESLVALGNGFLQNENNSLLRDKVLYGKLTPKDYYRQLMRIIYRLLFLMVTEERDLIYDPEDKTEVTQRFKNYYLQFYSISRLRKLSMNKYVFEEQFCDLWQGLANTFLLFEGGVNSEKMGIKPLAGDLFSYNATADLEDCLINNKLLLECIRNLNEFTDADRNLVSINYRSLDVEELGSVYEGLLELHPVIENIASSNPGNISFTFHEGTDRKTTGSYYTRPDLVNELIKSALIPVIEERLKQHNGNKELQAKALLKLKVCDAAAGSGHMVLAAARTIGWYLARVISGEDNPAPSVYRSCLRDVIQHCIYAVDMNPDAVELCKLALWIEGHNSGKPLSFLDHKIRNGNSLVGVTDLNVLKRGIPNEAYNPVTGDDKAVCAELKKANQPYLKFLEGKADVGFQKSLDFGDEEAETHNFSTSYHQLEDIRQDNIEAVQQVKKRFEKLRSDRAWFNDWNACNIWTSAFFFTYTLERKANAPTSERLAGFMKNPAAAYGPMVGRANALAMEHRFFHWPLEFPDVFEQGGFDLMLGNPPWEIIELKEQEFFANRDSKIANAENKAERTRLINRLSSHNSELFSEYIKESHYYDSARKFLKESGRNPLTAVGRINMYPIFAENYSNLINQKGRTGIIVPTGIATDDGNKDFFGSIIDKNRLVSLFDFENKEAIFQDVHRSYKFCLLTLAGSDISSRKAQFGFFLTNVTHLHDKMRIFSLSKDDFLRLNPNTKTCPVFRTRLDAELTTKIYQRVPVLINEATGENPWRVSFKQGLFNMSSDSNLFRTRQQLEAAGFEICGNRMKRKNEVWLPLYESKLLWHYDHRFGSYAGVDSRTSTQTPTPSVEQYQDPNYLILPWYWVEETLVNDYMNSKFVIGFRRITNNTNERTFVNSLIAKNGFGDNTFLMFSSKNALQIVCLNCLLSSLPFDFICRQKLAGMNMNFFYVNQFPVLSPDSISDDYQKRITKKSIELTYTSWDIKPFADDVWKEADEELKATISKQWEENQAVTGGHTFSPPDWCEIDPEGCPLPPFKWDEERRAVLKAELDAIYAKIYGLTTEELLYILDPQDVYGPDFPGETFRVLKDKEMRLYGEYRTRRLVLEAWERMNEL